MSDITTINRVQYSGLDFSTIEDDLLGRLQIQFATTFNDFSLSSLGIMLLDVISFGLDTLSFYLDRRATDNFLATARTRKSVAKLTRQLGYKMRPATAASADLNVFLQSTYAFDVTIPKGFQFKGPTDDLVFEAAESVTFPAGWAIASFLTVPVYQGETFSETFTSDGTANQVFQLRRVPDGSFVVSGSVIVTVAGATFTESDFLEFDTTDQFEVGYNDDPTTIRFGDGIAGNIPASGASIVVTYIASKGKSGKVSADTIQSEVTPLVVSFTTIPLTVTNPLSSEGGDDPEDLEHAKSFAGKVFKSRQVAITAEDYMALAGSFADPLFGRVAVAHALSARSAATDLELQSYLTTIQDAVNACVNTVVGIPTPPGAISTLESGFTSIVATLSTAASNLLSTLTAIAADSAAIASDATAALATAKTTKNRTADVTGNATLIQSQATTLQSALAAVASGGLDTLTTTTKNSLLDIVTDILGMVANVSSSGSTISANLDSIITNVEDISAKSADIGADLVTSGTQLTAAATQRSSILAVLGAGGIAPTGLYAQTAAISGSINTELITTIDTNLTNINDHVNKIVSADCKANVVNVPILAKDSNGFYVAPSLSLMKALQRFLDARKEVTQTVFVVSGKNFLIRPVMTVRVGAAKSAAQSVVLASVTSAIDGLLRDREFGATLFVSDIVNIILAVSGVVFCNVTITGYTRPDIAGTFIDKLDANGNLTISDSEVITKNVLGSDITITIETAS